MKKIILPALFLPAFLFAQIPANYYDGTAGLTGYALKSKVHDIISAKAYSYNYNEVNGLYPSTDADHYYENDGTVLDIYSEKPAAADAYNYDFTQNVGSASAEGQGWNREHGMPQSTFYGIYPMYSDIHYLIPADAYINQRRSNYPYARSSGSSIVFSNGSKFGTSTTPGYTNSVYEPIDEFKGDVARYLLYFVTRYEGSLNSFNYLLNTCPLDGTEEKAFENWYITMLKEWNTLDPVSQREIDRNNAVYNFQKVRNPFIDHPEWVDAIWTVSTDAVAPQAPTNLTSTQTGESFVKLSWTPSTDADVLGYRIFLNGNYMGYSKTNTFYLDRLTSGSTNLVTVRAYDGNNNVSADSNTLSVTTLTTDSAAKDLIITKYIEGTASTDKAIEITNKTTHPVNLNNYYILAQFYGNGAYYMGDAYKLEGTISPGEAKVITRIDETFQNYPVTSADFVTNAPAMTFSGSNYVELAYGTKYLKTASTNNYAMAYTTVDAVGVKGQSNSATLANVSLYRNTDVTDPNVNFTISEWTVNPANYITNLGTDNLILSTSETTFADDFTLYPNPVTDGILYIKGKNSTKILKARVYDMSGRLVLDQDKPFQFGNGLDVSFLPSGNYILDLGSATMQFIKK